MIRNGVSNAEPHLTGTKRQKLGTGTGFIREIGDRHFLITARHNLTGLHPDTNRHISPTGGIPNEVDVEGFQNQIGSPCANLFAKWLMRCWLAA